MLNWLWKKLGYHICEEFTQWQTFQQNRTRMATEEEWFMHDIKTVAYSVRYQRRRCTLCGKVEERKLDF